MSDITQPVRWNHLAQKHFSFNSNNKRWRPTWSTEPSRSCPSSLRSSFSNGFSFSSGIENFPGLWWTDFSSLYKEDPVKTDEEESFVFCHYRTCWHIARHLRKDNLRCPQMMVGCNLNVRTRVRFVCMWGLHELQTSIENVMLIAHRDVFIYWEKWRPAVRY